MIPIAYQPWLSTQYRTRTQPAAQWGTPIPNVAARVDAGGPAGNYYRMSPDQMSRILTSGMGCVGCMGATEAGSVSLLKVALVGGVAFIALKWIFG